jgi:hypothetical protein
VSVHQQYTTDALEIIAGVLIPTCITIILFKQNQAFECGAFKLIEDTEHFFYFIAKTIPSKDRSF